MQLNTYSPQPLDTSDVLLPDTLITLLERLAENTHDVWAAQRIKEGWEYGPMRDDANKKHPCLVPYVDLPESEKEYDRKTSAETIKAVMALGYVISK
jgi:ryanodine receptor 2